VAEPALRPHGAAGPAISPRIFEDLAKPYRSYRAGYVFRNEKPGPGRFRQFMQFDADTVGAAGPGGRRRDVHDDGRHAWRRWAFRAANTW
jgi:histidyl-tRNA synthetase